MTMRGIVVAAVVSSIAFTGAAVADPGPRPMSAGELRCRAQVERYLKKPGWSVTVWAGELVTCGSAPDGSWLGRVSSTGAIERKIGEKPWEKRRRRSRSELAAIREALIDACRPDQVKPLWDGARVTFYDARGRALPAPDGYPEHLDQNGDVGLRVVWGP